MNALLEGLYFTHQQMCANSHTWYRTSRAKNIFTLRQIQRNSQLRDFFIVASVTRR